jgi:hypothetical protein
MKRPFFNCRTVHRLNALLPSEQKINPGISFLVCSDCCEACLLPSQVLQVWCRIRTTASSCSCFSCLQILVTSKFGLFEFLHSHICGRLCFQVSFFYILAHSAFFQTEDHQLSFSVTISTFLLSREPFRLFSMCTSFFLFRNPISNSPVILPRSFCVIFQASFATYLRPCLLGCCAEYVGSCLPAFRDILTVPWRWAGKHLPLCAACISQKNEGINFVFSFRVQNLLIPENRFSKSFISSYNFISLSRDLKDLK